MCRACPCCLCVTLGSSPCATVFFEKREGFQWSSLLMNPMAIMMGVTLLIMVVFPKMMANMDPEQLKEMQQMQGGIADMLNPEKLKEKQQQQLKEKRKDRRG
mmetsp:Transcript_37525/g.65937  ORF Transcript_37525/g.65937 Transcript_37525/m.65937 type:complete len:102 (-) Transcript_37525:24-329(-)